MSGNIVKIGIIGFGRMGITHYSIINSHPDVQITAVVDKSGLILNLLKKNISGISTYTDYKDLLQQESLDAVLVCTPPNLHYEIIRDCCRKGIHVFVEKPFTTESRLANDLADQFEQSNLVNQVGYVNRYNDVFSKVRFFLEKELIGNIVRFRSEMYSRTVVKPEQGSSWRSSRETGGGVVFEMASHSLDLVNFLFGKPDKITGSSLNRIYSKNIEDEVSSTLLYRKNLSGSLYVNWSDASYRKPTNKVEIFGTKGKIIADQYSLKIFLNESNSDFSFRSGWNALYITDVFKPVPFYVRGNEFTSQLYDFVDCVKSGEHKSRCTFREASRTLEVIEMIYTDYNNNGRL